MVKTEMYPIAMLLPVEELDRRIRSLEKDARVLKRLYFVRYRYDGLSVEEAAKRVGVTRMVGYEWQRRWNQDGVEGLVPRFAGGRPSKLGEEQKKELKSFLAGRDDWTTVEVRDLILEEFGVEYTLKQVRVILKGFGMKHGKPYQQDHRRPVDAEEQLKKLGEISLLDSDIIGFLDKSSPQTTSNTVRVRGFNKPRIAKNTTRIKANTFGFYSLNGSSLVDFQEDSKKEDVCLWKR